MKLSMRTGFCTSLAIALFISCGCATFPPFANKSIPAETSKSSKGEYQVVLISPFGKSTIYSGEISEGLTVQGALEKSGALKKFRSMDVEMVRTVADTGRTMKMAFDFQPAKRILKFEQDYQVLPGDKIVVTAKSSALERLFSKD